MVLMWMEAWAGALGLGKRITTGSSGCRAEAIWRVPAWQRRRDRRDRREWNAGSSPAAMAANVRPVLVSRNGSKDMEALPRPRRFWIRIDRRVQGHAALGGSFAEVCAALERLAAVEEGRA